jgi:hypothetical protein
LVRMGLRSGFDTVKAVIERAGWHRVELRCGTSRIFAALDIGNCKGNALFLGELGLFLGWHPP